MKSLILALLLASATPFLVPTRRDVSCSRNTNTLPLSMCICVDCAFVTNCTAYHFVESKHEQPHMTDHPTFEPHNGSPTVHVNIRTRSDDQVVQRMWKEHAKETEKAGDGNSGETKYDLQPETTYEYDVVACEDFVLDKGCWVRNMPEEIRRANPDFVPT